MLHGQGLDLVVVHFARVVIDAVLDGVVDLTGEIDLGAVGQVAAVGQAHAQHRITRGTEGLVYRRVGLGAGVGLHVGIIRAEQGLDPINGQHFSLVHILATAIVALAGVALGILVGHDAALGFQHTGAGIVL